MNATWLLNLYPTSWRQRYEPEFPALLEERSVSALDALDIAFGAIDAHLRPRQPRLSAAGGGGSAPPIGPRPDAVAEARRRVTWLKLFYGHAALFAIVNLALLIINLLTTPAEPWFLFPIWGWGIPLALHAGLTFRWRGLFGAHLATFLVLNAGLIAINRFGGGEPWSLWPLWSLGILLVAHGLMAFGITGLFGAHVVATVLAGVELLVVAAIAPFGTLDVLWITALLAVLVAAHALLGANRVGLYRVHLFTFVVANALLFLQNVTTDRDVFWFQYPLVGWSIVFALHTLVRFRVLGFPDSFWEQATLARLTATTAQDRDDGPAAQALRRRVRLQRGLLLHLFLFGAGALDLAVLNILSTPDVVWAIWPIGVGAVLLAGHAGFVLIKPRLFGAHQLAAAGTALGLIAIDVATPGGP